MSDERERLAELAGSVADDLLAYFVRRVPNREDAADLLGDTLAALAARPGRIPPEPGAARMWAFGIARRTLLAGRRRWVRRSTGAETLRAAAVERVAGFAGDDSDADRHAVRAAVRALPRAQREIVMLVHWDGFGLDEAATLLGIPASTARSRHARAKAALRSALSDDHEAASAPRSSTRGTSAMDDAVRASAP